MKIASKTDTGRVRTNNEDSILVDQERGIFLLADGMGGHNAGEVASKLAVRTAHDFLKDRISTIESDEELLSALDAAIMRAHEAIKEKAASDIKLRGMGTTLVALVTKNEKAYICHVGDSRAYLLRDSLKQLTKDHTMGEYLVEQKVMSHKKVPAQQWHTLTQAVGVGEYPVPDKNTFDLKYGDLLLLCSDGLTDMLADEEIAAIIKKVSFPPAPAPSGAGLVVPMHRDSGERLRTCLPDRQANRSNKSDSHTDALISNI
ncbi:MAG: protein phosphatase 2C domain-containing protein, partial [Chloroflexota bacterium]